MHRRLLLLLLLAACRRDAATTIEGHGTIEVTESDVAPLTTARVLRVAVEEGEMVRPGDTLVVLTQSSMPATIEAQRARVLASQAALTDLERGARKPEIDAAEAELSGAEAEVVRTALERDRMRALAANRAVSQQSLDNAEAAARTATSRRDAAAEQLALLRAGSRPDRIRQARADVANARASLAATEATAGDLVLLASHERARGRVLGILSVCIGTNPVGALAVGFIATFVGAPVAFGASAALALLLMAPVATRLLSEGSAPLRVIREEQPA